MTRLSEQLRALRGTATLYEVGQEIGVDRSIISRYERGKIAPLPPLLRKLADYYEVEYKSLRMLYLDDTIPEKEEQAILFEWSAKKLGLPEEFAVLVEKLKEMDPEKQKRIVQVLISELEKQD